MNGFFEGVLCLASISVLNQINVKFQSVNWALGLLLILASVMCMQTFLIFTDSLWVLS